MERAVAGVNVSDWKVFPNGVQEEGPSGWKPLSLAQLARSFSWVFGAIWAVLLHLP